MATNETLAGKKVMWIEDDPFLSDILARKLSLQGAYLLHAPDATKALAIMEKETPDVLLLDVLLPGENGFEVLEKIRKTPKGEKLPVIFLSNIGQKEDIDRAAKLGAKKFLIKAVATLDEIVEEIQKATA